MQTTILTTLRHALTRRYAPYAATAMLAGWLSLTGVMAQIIPTAHAGALTVRYERGYSVQSGGWLCYGWANGAYHCTRHWRVSGGRYVSLNPSWVPSEGAAASSSHAASHPATTYSYHVANTYPWGQCTYWAAATAHDNVSGLGDARDWLWRAQKRGMATGYTPRVGATVVFAPGVQGASWLGHVAHVVAVYSGGAFRVEEMNYYGYGGGFGKISYRTAWTQPGVAFIY